MPQTTMTLLSLGRLTMVIQRILLLDSGFCYICGISVEHQKSTVDVQHLIDEVTLYEDFKAEDLQEVKLTQEVKKLDTFESSLEGQGWKRGSVKISVPCPKEKVLENEAMEFEVDGILCWDSHHQGCMPGQGDRALSTPQGDGEAI